MMVTIAEITQPLPLSSLNSQLQETHCSYTVSLPSPLQSFLAIEDVGDTLDSVEALIKKHENFEKSLAAQEEKFKALEETAARLLEADHYGAEEIDTRRQAVSPP